MHSFRERVRLFGEEFNVFVDVFRVDYHGAEGQIVRITEHHTNRFEKKKPLVVQIYDSLGSKDGFEYRMSLKENRLQFSKIIDGTVAIHRVPVPKDEGEKLISILENLYIL